MYQKYYSEFLNAHVGKIHFAAHSHHFWPDSARIGHIESYENSVKSSDHKWDYIFKTIIPDVQNIISDMIHFDRPKDIAFAPNTHDLLTRILSSLMGNKKLRILTTNCEFHSFSRQLRRLQEDDLVEVIILNPEMNSFDEDLEKALKENEFDLIFLSHVFFNTGLILSNSNIETIIKHKKEAHFILDAYHGFCAVPTDLSKFGDDLYYMAGGYKYAQAGEGMCFMTLPKNCHLRPLFTGWFASFDDLAGKQQGAVAYSNDGMRLWGSTIDCTAFFRFRAVWNHFKASEVSLNDLMTYTKTLQEKFLSNNPFEQSFISTDIEQIGYFSTMKLENGEKAALLSNQLLERGFMTDYRGSYLRFGHAPYHSHENVDELKNTLKSLIL